jgi:hypothetical protein
LRTQTAINNEKTLSTYRSVFHWFVFSNEQLANTIMIKAILKSKIGFEELSKCPSKHAILSEGP